MEEVFCLLVLPRSAAQSCEDDRGVEHGNWREKPGQWIFVWMFAGYSNVVGEELAEGCLSPSLVVFVSKWLILTAGSGGTAVCLGGKQRWEDDETDIADLD